MRLFISLLVIFSSAFTLHAQDDKSTPEKETVQVNSIDSRE